MRMRRLGLAMMTASIGAMTASMDRMARTSSLFSRSLESTKNHKNKPNKLSQKKRRLNARRLGKSK